MPPAALFTGAALYVSAVEHPARRNLDPGGALAEWKPAYKRGAVIQAPLALTGFVLGLAAWWLEGGWLWLAGAFVLVANWPYTLLVIRPVNNRLLATRPAEAGSESQAWLEKWARLHMARTLLGAAAMILFLAASPR